MTDPKPMPLEDGSGKEFDHSNTPWPDGKTDKLDAAQPAAIASAIPTFSSTGFSYPGFPGAPGPESWLVRVILTSHKQICDNCCDCVQIKYLWLNLIISTAFP